MRTVIARIFDYSVDGIIATEDTSFFDFCRDLPDDPALEDHTRAFYEGADAHIMGRKHYQDAAQYFPEATDHPYADAMNAARKIVPTVALPLPGRPRHAPVRPPGPLT